MGHGCKLQQNGECTFFFTMYLAHIYIACVCTFIHAVYTEDKYIFKEKKIEEKSERQTGKAVLLCRWMV